jgi:hypothetical protein
MARNNGVTVRAAIDRLSDVAVVQLVSVMAAEYSRYLDAVTQDPTNAIGAVGKSAATFREYLRAGFCLEEGTGQKPAPKVTAADLEVES